MEMTFEQWIKEVDKVMEKKIHLAHDDLPDWHWMDAFDDGDTPKEAVGYFFEDEGMEEFL